MATSTKRILATSWLIVLMVLLAGCSSDAEDSTTVSGRLVFYMMDSPRVAIKGDQGDYEVVTEEDTEYIDFETDGSSASWELGHIYELEGVIVDTTTLHKTYIHKKTIIAKEVRYVGPPPYDPEEALGRAIVSNDVEEAKKAILKGADIHRSSENGETILHFAAEHGQWDVVSMLIEKGLDVNAIGSQGRTPLHAAIESRRACSPEKLEIIEGLLTNGADAKIQNNYGVTPWETATELPDGEECRSILVRYRAVHE